MIQESTDNTVVEYRTTKADCQAGIDLNGYVCSRCGGTRTPIETVDNSGNPTFWPGCESCQVFNYGVRQHIYDIAKHMVDKENYIHYSHMDNPHDRKDDEWYANYWRCSQIDGAVGIIMDILRLDKLLTNGNEQPKT